MDKIIIKDALFLSRIGVSPEERRKKQEIYIDLELFFAIGKVVESDDIEQTVNYSEVHEFIKKLIEKHEWKLIETMASTIANAVLRAFPIQRILIRLKKPRALMKRKVKYVAVEI